MFSANIPQSDCIKEFILETFVKHLMEEQKDPQSPLLTWEMKKKVKCL